MYADVSGGVCGKEESTLAAAVIHVPRINATPSDFADLFSIRAEAGGLFTDVQFDFSNCDFLAPNAVACLGGIARLVDHNGGQAVFNWGSMSPKVLMNLRQNGFAGKFGDPSGQWDGNSIPYREDGIRDVQGIMEYLTYRWLGKGWVRVPVQVANAIAGQMWEIYGNAFEHSNTQIGVFSCGQYFPQMNELVLTAIDFGQGIPQKIRTFLGQDDRAQTLSSSSCLQWAFGRGNSTSVGKVARGLGLDLLKEFVASNRGKMEVYSNDGYAIIDERGDRYSDRNIGFEGTIVYITLHCDESLYQGY